MFSRFKTAARILLRGEPKKKKRHPIPAITADQVAEIKQFFSREKFFIFGHARSGTTLLMRLVRLHPEVHCNYQAHFFTRQNGKLTGTLLLLVLVIVEVTDLVFAVDSIPAIFAITTNTFIVYTSNVFAILGLRSMYFLLAGVVEKFQYLKMGLAIVLTFIGTKMLVVALGINIPIWASLVFVAVVLLLSVVASVLWPKECETGIEVDLPEDFDSPFEDDEPEAPKPLEIGVNRLREPLCDESREEEPESVERR